MVRWVAAASGHAFCKFSRSSRVEKLCIGLASPTQIRRVGNARAEVRRQELLVDASVVADLAELRPGRRVLDARGRPLAFSPVNTCWLTNSVTSASSFTQLSDNRDIPPDIRRAAQFLISRHGARVAAATRYNFASKLSFMSGTQRKGPQELPAALQVRWFG